MLSCGSQQRLQNWRQELDSVVESMGLDFENTDFVSVNTFLTLTLRNIAGSLDDLKHLTEALAQQRSEQTVRKLLNCPRCFALTEALEETIKVLARTKSSFKSKELGDLRKKLEKLVAHSGQPGHSHRP